MDLPPNHVDNPGLWSTSTDPTLFGNTPFSDMLMDDDFFANDFSMFDLPSDLPSNGLQTAEDEYNVQNGANEPQEAGNQATDAPSILSNQPTGMSSTLYS